MNDKQNLELAVNSEKTAFQKECETIRRCGNLNIETYDKNWNFIVGVRATIEINGTEWGRYETSP